MTISGELTESGVEVPSARVKVSHLHWDQPIDVVLYNDDRAYLDLCLTRRPPRARGSYPRFGDQDFEPLGGLMFVPAGVPLHARAGTGAQWALQCWLGAEAFEDLNVPWDIQRLRAALHLTDHRLQASCTRLAEELTSPGFATEAVTSSICDIIAIDLVRHFSNPIVRRLPRGGLPGWRLRRVEERVRADGAPPTLEELAEICHMSARHLTRAFRQQTGVTVGDFILKGRIERAKELLGGDDLSLKEISERLGFATASAFSTAFRRATGERPSQHRIRVRAERSGASWLVGARPS